MTGMFRRTQQGFIGGLRYSSRARKALAALCVGATAMVAPVHAQTTADQTDEAGKSNEALGGEIIVTARKRAERLVDIPLAITAVGSEELDRGNISNAKDLAPFVPNFSINEQQSPGVAFINVRGISQARFGEPPISVVVDGVQITNSYQITQEFTDVERVEVLKGPQGALYGRNAIGGAMVITTKRPGDRWEGSLEAEYGTADNVKAAVSLRGPIVEDKLGFKFAADFQDFDGDIINVRTGNGANFAKQFNIRTGLYASPADGLDVDIIYSRLRTDAGGAWYAFPAPNPNIVGDWSSRIDNQAFRDIDDVSFKATWDAGPFTLTSVTGYSKVSGGLKQDFRDIAGVFLDADQRISTEAFTQEIRIASPDDGRKFAWMIGGYHSDIDFTSNTKIWLQNDPDTDEFAEGPQISDADRQETRKNYSVFGQFLYRFDMGLQLTAAFRYEKDKQSSSTLFPGQVARVSSDAFQPRVSAAYFFNRDSQLYVSAARGFRAAGFNGTAVVRPRYEPETVWTYEVGYKFVNSDRSLSTNIALFYNDIHNRQLYALVFFPAFDQIIANPVKRSRAYGIEADVMWRPLERMTLQASIGLIDTKITDYDVAPFGGHFVGNELPLSPRVSYSFVGQYEIPLGAEFSLTPRIEVNGKSSFWWEVNNKPIEKNKPIHLVNARLIAQHGDFSLTGFVENLFDKKYNAEYLAGGFAVTGGSTSAAAPGRRWGVRAKFSF